MSVITGQGVTAYPLPDEELSPTSKNAVSNEAVCEGLDEIKNTLSHKADVIYDTASGDIASFPDGADGLPVKDLTVGIEPVQDLHGYENPWPAGGGVNQWDEEWETGDIDNNGQPTQSTSLIRAKNYNACKPDTAYYVKKPTEASVYMKFYDEDKNFISPTISANGIITTPSNCYYFKFVIGSSYGTTYNYDISINYPATVTTYSPYSNICPISGWTGANVTRTGFNIWDEVWEYNGIDDTTGQNKTDSFQCRSKNYIPAVSNQAYFIKIGDGTDVDTSDSTKPQIWAYAYNKNKEYIGRFTRTGTDSTRVKNSVVITPAECCYIRFKYYYTTESRLAYKHDICINVSDATKNGTYEPYNPASTTIPISWQSEAGTVYGGTLELPSCVLTVTDANIASYNGETLPGEWISDRDVYAAGTTPTTGAQVVYKLATPQTYQLTPQEIITTLLGQNNIWSDTGSSTVEYPADTKLYIQKINTPTDDDMIADANIANGKYFIVNNNLYISTAAILAGDPIKPGTNCTLTNLAAALNALNS